MAMSVLERIVARQTNLRAEELKLILCKVEFTFSSSIESTILSRFVIEYHFMSLYDIYNEPINNVSSQPPVL